MNLFDFPYFNSLITLIVYVFKVLLEMFLVKVDKTIIRNKIFGTGVDLSFFGMSIYSVSIARAIALGSIKFDQSNSHEFNVFLASIFIFLIVIIITIVTYRVSLILSEPRIERFYSFKIKNTIKILLCIGLNHTLGFLAFGYGLKALKI